jgi:DNA-directed RNA polymerase subunit K/omega
VARKGETGNTFEFVTVAGARARQLLAGCTPKVESDDTPVKTAQREVREGVVQKVELTAGD